MNSSIGTMPHMEPKAQVSNNIIIKFWREEIFDQNRGISLRFGKKAWNKEGFYKTKQNLVGLRMHIVVVHMLWFISTLQTQMDSCYSRWKLKLCVLTEFKYVIRNVLKTVLEKPTEYTIKHNADKLLVFI